MKIKKVNEMQQNYNNNGLPYPFSGMSRNDLNNADNGFKNFASEIMQQFEKLHKKGDKEMLNIEEYMKVLKSATAEYIEILEKDGWFEYHGRNYFGKDYKNK